MDDDPEHKQTSEHGSQSDREAERGEQAQHDDGVEQDARVARIAEQFEQNADQHGAEHHPCLTAGAAEDHHRVDR